MLSRVAEKLYWAARYLERVENTARLVSVYHSLLLDLPDNINISWYNLVTLNSCTDEFEKRYKNKSEINVVKFFLADKNNSASIVYSLMMARENIRTTRDVLPNELWEDINELHLYVKDHIQQGINRSARYEFLDRVIKARQEIHGVLTGTLRQDECWNFLNLGRNIERADMTTRILDAGIIMHMDIQQSTVPKIDQIIWGHVLGSLSANYAYRRGMRSAIKASLVTKFLLEDKLFPRTLRFCFDELLESATLLPHPESIASVIRKMRKSAFTEVPYNKLDQEFRDYLNAQQLNLATLDQAIAKNWFYLRKTPKGD